MLDSVFGYVAFQYYRFLGGMEYRSGCFCFIGYGGYLIGV